MNSKILNSDRQVPQSGWAKNLNVLGRSIGAASVVPLSVDNLIKTAKETTSLSDFGDDDFMQGLTALVDSLNNEAQLTLTGRLIAHTEIARLLQSRLAIINTEKRYPEIQNEAIREPLFIVGMGRTGSSILYEYFMQDPAHRAPVAWEKKIPCNPRADLDQEQSQQFRIDWVEAETQLMYQVDESLLSKHEANAFLPEECSQLMAHEFRSGHFFSRNHVPSYAGWNALNDVRPALNMHKRILKILQWQTKSQPAPRWILKYGGHMGCMPELFETYPDAKVIHTHRDPAAVVQSMTSLIASLRLMRSDHFDAIEAAAMLNSGMARGLEKLIQERTNGTLPASQIVDVHFADLMQDTLGCISRTYEALDIPFTNDAKRAIQQYMNDKPRSKHGKHVYAYADIIDWQAETARFKNYVQHYAVTPEA